MPDADVAGALSRLEMAPLGALVPLAPGLSARKGAVSAFEPALDSSVVPDVCPLAIAYLFLACVLGRAIYTPKLQPVRDALALNSHPESAWKVEALIAQRSYEPWHGLAVERILPHFVVQIRLFAQLAWLVHFTSVRGNAKSAGLAYRGNLEGEELVARIAG
jgi:hypothetical protein